MRAERQDLFSGAEKMVLAARESGKDLVGVALAQYTGLLAQIKALDSQIEKAAKVGASSANYGIPVSQPTAFARDTEGRRLPIFAKGESIAAHMRQESGSP